MSTQLALEGFTPQPMTRRQVTRQLLAMFPVSPETASVLAAIILGMPVFAATLSGIRNRGTFGPFRTERAAGGWAAGHARPTSSFLIPVQPPSTLEWELDA